ncbi:cysteine dioxygenase family protein [Legionella fallonii]|uniref:Putative Cysteine dioxygenase type I [cupin region] n=1 Tax=Legionella fallonii LLAP-10 TaxID=1212491 RepID=A0A098G4Z2_9GAMM|nr:cupin [Legionella fallonii]CEG57553.1 putative Cysteine dioxygenase type I [cupin region] [Legionella fallonii LLAP-10]
MTFSIPQGLKPFVAELQALDIKQYDDNTNIARVSALVAQWVKRQDWLEEKYFYVDPKAGFSSWLIHEEEDHSLAVNLVAWEPGREITPHEHKTWGVVGSVVGVEKNYLWIRIDDGSKPEYAEIKRQNAAIICPAGGIISFLPDEIHSVINESEKVAISLHVYGKNLNYTGRYQYDPINNTMQPFIVNFG